MLLGEEQRDQQLSPQKKTNRDRPEYLQAYIDAGHQQTEDTLLANELAE